MGRKLDRIRVDMNEGSLEHDLEKYKKKAIELGATKAEIIPVEKIHVDERVILKCQIPRCFGYGVCAQCPPNTLKPSELREHLKKYRLAVFFITDVSPEVIVRDKATIKERVEKYKQVYKIVSEIESLAFHDGHYLAFGLADGSCRYTYCGEMKDCQVMRGEECQFPLLSRPSMEAVGIDVYKMVAEAGWEIYPIGSNARPEDIPKGTFAGIVIVQ